MDNTLEQAAKAVDRWESAQAKERAAREARDKAFREALDAGHSVAAIARATGFRRGHLHTLLQRGAL